MPDPVCPGNGLVTHVSGTGDSGTIDWVYICWWCNLGLPCVFQQAVSCRQYKWLSIIHVFGWICHLALFPNLDHFGDLVYSFKSCKGQRSAAGCWARVRNCWAGLASWGNIYSPLCTSVKNTFTCGRRNKSCLKHFNLCRVGSAPEECHCLLCHCSGAVWPH